MESSTKILRRLLDERGVEWGANDTYRLLVTSWIDASGHSWAFMEHRYGSFSKLTAYHLTPEQAIAATLGSCNCSNNCTNGERTETCKLINAADDLGKGTSSCMCFECGYTALDDWWDEFKYCPNCGRKVVEPTTNDVDTEEDA